MESNVNSSDITAIIPCCSKALTIPKVVDDFHRELPGATVYAHDNNSTDSTAQIAREHGASVKFEPRQSKGGVRRQMFPEIEADCYLMADGNDTYPAESVHALCIPILIGEANMAVDDHLSNGTYAEENKRAFTNLATTMYAA